jgi:hypothetical protein
MTQYSGYQRIRRKRNHSLSTEENLIKQSHQTPKLPATNPVSQVTASTMQRVQTTPQNLKPHEMLQLQSTIGNRALTRMVTPTPQVQRRFFKVQRRSTPIKKIQRWPWSRRNETNEQKIERYEKKISSIDTAVDVLRVGHGIVMLPVTLIDLLSNLIRPFTGHSASPKSNNQARNTFHNVLNGESQFVALMAGHNGYMDLGILKYAPWNVIPWIIGILSRWRKRLRTKISRLNGNN